MYHMRTIGLFNSTHLVWAKISLADILLEKILKKVQNVQTLYLLN